MTEYHILHYPELDSTNRHAVRHLDELVHGTVIHADMQTAGHGRYRRPWLSDVPGNLCMSIILKPACRPASALPLAGLSQLMALEVCRTLDDHVATAAIKWPNDILAGGRKIGGILVETIARGSDEFLGLVLGLGVNLNLNEEMLSRIDQPATSLSLWTGCPVEVPAFRDRVLDKFFEDYENFLAGGFQTIRRDFENRCAFLGNEVVIRRPDGEFCGTAVRLTDEGELEIDTPSSGRIAVSIGEMFEVGPLRDAPPGT
jgi:BirA family biotin operon repressor/biotin-[acetyl-CoA-carboxylase] ligase